MSGALSVSLLLTESTITTIRALATVVDVSEPDLFALIASSLTFSFDARGNPDPEHQDVLFRALTGSRVDPADLVWGSADENGAVVPLRLTRRMLLASRDSIQIGAYASITMDPPEDIELAASLGNRDIQSLASIGGVQHMMATNGAAGAQLIRFTLDLDGTVSAQTVVRDLSWPVATDHLSVAGTGVPGDVLILTEPASGTPDVRRYTANGDMIAALTLAQGVDMSDLHAPSGMAPHEATDMIVVDNTANNVPALYAMRYTETAIASLISLGTVTAMSGLTAAAIMVDTPGQAVIVSTEGRLWRVFYDINEGLGSAALMSSPSGIFTEIAAVTNLSSIAAEGRRWLDVQDFGDAQRVAVSISATRGLEDTTTVSRLRAGSDALTVIVTNEAIVLSASAAGEVATYAGAAGEVRIYRGTTRLTSGVTYTRIGADSNLGVTLDGGTGAYVITHLANGVDSATLSIRVEVGDFVVDRVIMITKALQGVRGSGNFDREITGTIWSNSEANSATTGDNRIGDRVTLYNN